MARNGDNNSYYDRVIILFLFALFLLLSPLLEWWAADESTWYAPYLVWLTLIILGYFVQRVSRRHEL